MNEPKEISVPELIRYWGKQRQKMVDELARRIREDDNPGLYQKEVKERYELIQATIRSLEYTYRPDILEDLKQRFELQERGYISNPSGPLMSRAFNT